MPRSRRLKLYEYVAELVDAGSGVLTTELKLPADQARAVMLRVARAVCERHGKSTVYIPDAANLANLERNALIWAAYQVDGPPPTCTRRYTYDRIAEIAAEHDMTPQWVYSIVRTQRDAELAERQPEIPGLDIASS